MTSSFEAICISGIVTTLLGEIIPGIKILGEGKGPSEGVAVVTESGAYYLPKLSSDITIIIDSLITDITQISTALGAIQASLILNDSGASSAAPVSVALATLAQNIILLNVLKAAQK